MKPRYNTTHKGSCRKKMSTICHCLTNDGTMHFYQCCGWYHSRCGGRIVDDLKQRKWSQEETET